VRHHQHPGAGRLRGLDGGQRRADARVTGHDAVLHRDVQVLADQDALAPEVEVGHADDAGHGGSPWIELHLAMTRAISRTLDE
jgi:hypothetical protein